MLDHSTVKILARKIINFLRRVIKMYEYHEKPNYSNSEFNEIAERIVSGKQPISWDDILDFFLELSKQEKLKTANVKKKDVPKERRVFKK
jgi:hypothetical protein